MFAARYPTEARRRTVSNGVRVGGIALFLLTGAAVGGGGWAASGASSGRAAGDRVSGRAAGSSQPAMPRSRALRGVPGRGDSAVFVAAVSRSVRTAPYGLAVFSSSDGRRLR